MYNKLIKAALLGGVVVFIWSVISWVALPLHRVTVKKFTNEDQVAEAIRNNTPESGIYVLPNTWAYNASTSKKEMESGRRMLEKGPVMFASISNEGMGKITPAPFIISLITQIIGAAIISWILLHCKPMTYMKQVAFVTLFGLGVALLGHLPNWNWWGFSFAFVFSFFIELVIGWFLAGLAIAQMLRR
ncbi:MAG: hypothetical protein JSS61_00520 [Verrucomicrobia bacterium]|nr:hypothetical protein [Verrucomicrobiota bacterium]